MILPINQFYNKDNPLERQILTTPAAPITEITNDIMQLYCDLQDTFNEHIKEASGLASNQIWTNTDIAPPAMIIFKVLLEENKDIYLVALNPEIKGTGSKIKAYESCLSLRNRKPVLKKRDKNVTITYMDIDKNYHTEKYTGIVARTIFHEYDHLLGKVI